jgi:hypothetical protein
MISHVEAVTLVDAVVLILHARGRASPCVAIHFEGIVLDQWAPVRNNPCHPGPACLLEMSRLGAYELVDNFRDGKRRFRVHELKVS